MALEPAPRPDQQPEPVIEAIAHLGDRHGQHPRCGQLDRQAGYRRGAGRSPPRRPPRRAVSEMSAPQRARARRTAWRRPSRLRCPRPARAPARVVRRRPAGPPGWWPGSVTVVERARMASIRSAAASSTCSQLSNTSSRERPSNAVATLSARLIPGCWVIPSTAATRLGYRGRIADRGQFDHPHAIGEAVGQPSGDLEREPGLAYPADTGQRHQPMRLAVPLQTSASSDSRPTKLVVCGA